jgi:hypothetical protein
MHTHAVGKASQSKELYFMQLYHRRISLNTGYTKSKNSLGYPNKVQVNVFVRRVISHVYHEQSQETGHDKNPV